MTVGLGTLVPDYRLTKVQKLATCNYQDHCHNHQLKYTKEQRKMKLAAEN